MKNENSAFFINNSLCETGLPLEGLPTPIRQGDPLQDISQCVAVLLHPILVNVSFVSLHSKHVQTHMTLVSQ